MLRSHHERHTDGDDGGKHLSPLQQSGDVHRRAEFDGAVAHLVNTDGSRVDPEPGAKAASVGTFAVVLAAASSPAATNVGDRDDRDAVWFVGIAEDATHGDGVANSL